VYIAVVVLLMFVFPLGSMAVERFYFASGAGFALLAGKWFGFWSVGVRLLLAGMRQIANPKYTAEKILGIKSQDSWFVIRELGFANFALGWVGLFCVFRDAWIMPAAWAGAIFYGLAGVNHTRERERGRLQTIAMWSDLFMSVVLWGAVIGINRSKMSL
jgi:hypothetical protein